MIIFLKNILSKSAFDFETICLPEKERHVLRKGAWSVFVFDSSSNHNNPGHHSLQQIGVLLNTLAAWEKNGADEKRFMCIRSKTTNASIWRFCGQNLEWRTRTSHCFLVPRHPNFAISVSSFQKYHKNDLLANQTNYRKWKHSQN